MKFKCIYEKSAFQFKGKRYTTADVFETADKELIGFLSKNKNFIKLKDKKKK